MDLNDEILKTIIFSDFMRKLALVHVACRYLCYIIHQRQRLKRRRVPHIPPQSTIERQKVHDELMSRLRNSKKCYDVIRMGPQAFQGLCDILWRDGDHQDTQRAMVEEQVGKFLHMLVHNQTTRTMSFFFCHFGETISRHFHSGKLPFFVSLMLHVLECHHKMQCLLKVRKDNWQKMMNSGI